MIKITDLYVEKHIPEISELNLEIPAREIYVLLSSDERVFDHLVNIFSGLEREFKGQVKVDDMDIQSQWIACHDHIAYLESGGQWPMDMSVGHIVTFLKQRLKIPDDEFEEFYIKLNMDQYKNHKIRALEPPQWRKILLALTGFKKSGNYIIRDFARGMPLDFNLEFRKHLNLLKSSGASILYLSDDVFFAPEIGDRVGFVKKGKLLLELKASSLKKVSLKELYFQFLSER